jgi:4-diphosphocytidyl-2-C-methyl-D-erythritol kinase
VSAWHTRKAPAKLNLALVVGPPRPDGKHEVVSVMERVSLHDTISVRPATATGVSGFDGDTLVAAALDAIAQHDGAHFEARIEKRIPVAAGLGGGSSDAAAALRLANELLDRPLDAGALHRVAASLGADVPFFLAEDAQLATDDGTTLVPVTLPRDYVVLLALPDGIAKTSTRDVYEAFDARRGDDGYPGRRAQLLGNIGELRVPGDLARLPPNDLASSPLADELRAAGAFRADVTGAGPVVYGLFAGEPAAAGAAAALKGRARTWVARPG